MSNEQLIKLINDLKEQKRLNTELAGEYLFLWKTFCIFAKNYQYGDKN